MGFKTGFWGEQEKARSQTRKEYFKNHVNGNTEPALTVGVIGENIAKQWLTSAKLDHKTDHDLLWVRRQKIEVKTSAAKQWTFSIAKNQLSNEPNNYFFLICMKGKKVARIYFIPKDIVKVTSLKMGKENSGKYSQFRVV